MLTENLADYWNEFWKPRHPTVKAITKTVTQTAAWKQKSYFLWKCLLSVCVKCQSPQLCWSSGLHSHPCATCSSQPGLCILQACSYSYAVGLLSSPWMIKQPASGQDGPQKQNRTDLLPFLQEDLHCIQEQSPADLLSPGRRGMQHDKTPPVVQRPVRGMYFRPGSN